MNRKEYLKKYYLENKEKYNKQSNEWYMKNKSRAQFNFRKWRTQNKEHLKQYKHEHYIKNKESRNEERILLQESPRTFKQTSFKRPLSLVFERGERRKLV